MLKQEYTSTQAHNSKEAENAQARNSQESKTRCTTAPGEAPAQKNVSKNLPHSSDCGPKGRNPTGSHDPASIYFQIRLLSHAP